MPSTLSQTDLSNLALSQIGAKPIQLITAQDDPSAIACNTNWQLAFLAVAREHNWNCLMKSAVLAAVPQTPIVPPGPPTGATPWAPFTSYLANVFVTYGNALYQALIANTSTASFVNDLTSGYWFETDIFNPDPFGQSFAAGNYPSGWAFKFPLPDDYVKVAMLNGQNCFDIPWAIKGRDLYANFSQAVIQYVAALTDTTIYDSLFCNAFVFMLASKIATQLRQDSGAISAQMLVYYRAALSEARMKDANEGTPRRFSPVANSRFIASRWGSTND